MYAYAYSTYMYATYIHDILHTFLHECAPTCKKRKTDKLGIHMIHVCVLHLGAGPSN